METSPASSLPQFLKPIQSTQSTATQLSAPVHALYTHKYPFGDSHVLWWPAQTRRVCDSSNRKVPTTRTILLCIPGTFSCLDSDGCRSDLFLGRTHTSKKKNCFPSDDLCALSHRTSVRLGNPGLLEFYVPFLNAIYRSVNSYPSSGSSSSSSPSSTTTSVTIFAHSHLGLSSYIQLGGNKPDKSSSWPEKSNNVALRAQIQAHLEFLDELLVAYEDDPTTRVLLVGHSIGCWLIQEILKARGAGALRQRVGAYLLFPTISHIARSPNGRKLSVRISAIPPCSLLLDS